MKAVLVRIHVLAIASIAAELVRYAVKDRTQLANLAAVADVLGRIVVGRTTLLKLVIWSSSCNAGSPEGHDESSEWCHPRGRLCWVGFG